jgi:hypothetical protein
LHISIIHVYEEWLRGEIAAAKERHAGVFLQKVDGSSVD